MREYKSRNGGYEWKVNPDLTPDPETLKVVSE